MSNSASQGQVTRPSVKVGDLCVNAGALVRVISQVDPDLTGGIPHVRVRIVGLGDAAHGQVYAVEPRHLEIRA